MTPSFYVHANAYVAVMSTPSKLSIFRAAGKVQREMAEEIQVAAEVHPAPGAMANVTTRRAPAAAAVNPLETIADAQEELEDVSAELRLEQDVLRRLRRGAAGATDAETDIEDYVDAEEAQQEASGQESEQVFNSPPGTPFPSDWFAKVIGAAVSAAASAAASSAGPAPRSSKLKITDRKLPDFWEWQPVAWFRLFDRHVKPFKPSQAETFDALLPLLSSSACKHVQPIVRSPGLDPYTRARASLIRHFDKTPRDNAREFRRLESLGDMTPSDMLEHIYGLLPDPSIIYEVVFLDLLPPAARDAALQQTTLSAMAAAADKIVQEGSSAPASTPLQASAVSAVTAAMDDLSVDGEVAAVGQRRSQPSSSSRQRSAPRSPRRPRFLCSSHARWGKNSFRCADPTSCHMKDLIRPRQDGLPSSRQSGNGRAGGQ